MSIRTKDEQCSSSPNEMSTRRAVLKKGDAVAVFLVILEGEGAPSP